MEKLQVQESHRVTIRCKYLPVTNCRGSRISVSRYESSVHGRDPQRLVVSWDYALDPTENYTEAVRKYLASAQWGGQWVTSTVTDGAVAVCVDAVDRGN